MILVCINGWKLAVFSRKLHGARQIAPGVYETDRIEVPLVMGYLHPRIYLPAFLREEERGYILLHEQIHLHRRDYLIKPAGVCCYIAPLVQPAGMACLSRSLGRHGAGL